MDEAALVLKGVTKTFGDFRAVSDFSLEVGKGELVALLGPSGCGKTTTLRMIAGFERPTEGEISFAGKTLASVPRRIFVPPDKRNFGMVFQSYALWPHMTVYQNVAYPLKLRRVPFAERRKRVAALLDLMGLSRLIDNPVHTLSGGQQQRTSIARALVYEPALILFDEPFSNLDSQLRAQIRVELKTLQTRLHLTSVFVTHDQVEALSLADRIAIMRQGRIEQIGAPAEIYDRPINRFVYDFLGKNVTFEGVVTEIDADGLASIAVADNESRPVRARIAEGVRLACGAPASISIRSGDVAVERNCDSAQTEAVNRVIGRIETLLFTGDHQEARISIGGTPILLDLPRDRGWAEGERVMLAFNESAVTAWPTGSLRD